ncbi:hypothetical protein D3C74_412320 [compost metagenome]
MPEKKDNLVPLASSAARCSFQRVDSGRPRRTHQVTAATMNRWKKISRDPLTPNGSTMMARAKPTAGPKDQAS